MLEMVVFQDRSSSFGILGMAHAPFGPVDVRGVALLPLGIQVYKQYLHWALESVNITYIGLFGSLGFGNEGMCQVLNPKP